jgi:hypothetical protein
MNSGGQGTLQAVSVDSDDRKPEAVDEVAGPPKVNARFARQIRQSLQSLLSPGAESAASLRTATL